MTNLAVAYRPQRFVEVLGQDSTRWVLQTLISQATDKPFPPGVLLSGPSGVGKTTLARIIGRALNCADATAGEPCLVCTSCVQSLQGSHPAIVEIDAANFASADQARELVARVSIAHPFRHLVLILDECHAMSRQAWDVLLRTVEACPPGVTFVFCTTSPEKHRPEVQSRGFRFDLTSPPESHTAVRLQQVAEIAGRTLSQEAAFDLVQRSRGNVRTAYQLLEQVLLHPDADVTAVLGVGRFGLDLLEAAIKRDRLAGIRILDAAWERYSSSAEVYADWMDALESLLLAKLEALETDDAATAFRLRELGIGYHETMIAAGMEVVADWARRGGRRSALSFAWVSFLKAIGGPTVVDSAAIGAARKQARKATAADLSDFNL